MHLNSPFSVFSLVPLLFITDTCYKTSGYSSSGSHLHLIPLQGWVFWFYEAEIILGRVQSCVTNPNSRWGRKESVNENLLLMPHTHREAKETETLSTPGIHVYIPFSPQKQWRNATRHKAQWIIHTEIHIKGVLWVAAHELPMSRCWFPQCAHY